MRSLRDVTLVQCHSGHGGTFYVLKYWDRSTAFILLQIYVKLRYKSCRAAFFDINVKNDGKVTHAELERVMPKT